MTTLHVPTAHAMPKARRRMFARWPTNAPRHKGTAIQKAPEKGSKSSSDGTSTQVGTAGCSTQRLLAAAIMTGDLEVGPTLTSTLTCLQMRAGSAPGGIEVDPSSITICRRPDGAQWCLGCGAHGTVCGSQPHIRPRHVVDRHALLGPRSQAFNCWTCRERYSALLLCGDERIGRVAMLKRHLTKKSLRRYSRSRYVHRYTRRCAMA